MPSSTPVTLPPTAPRTAPPGLFAAALLHLLQQRLEDLPEARHVGLDPARRGPRPGPGCPRTPCPRIIRVKRPDVLLGGLGVPAQLRDDRPGLVPADVRARPHEAGRGRHREIPVDHLGTTDARHASTVRARDPQTVGVGDPPGRGARPPGGRPARAEPVRSRCVTVSRRRPARWPSRSRADWAAPGGPVPDAMNAKASSRPSGVHDRARQGVHAGEGAGLGVYQSGARPEPPV